MKHSGVVLVVVIQLAAFVGTLALGKSGFVSGEAAACAALIAWFGIGVPLSYSAVDIVARWQVKPAGERQPLPAMRSRSSSVAST